MESKPKKPASGDSYDPDIIEEGDYKEAETLGQLGLPTSSKDVKKMIATVSPGTLLLLGQTNQFFAALARDDTTWRKLFERDFPRDWAFIGGLLPLYVKPTNTNNGSAWKRFYLHTRAKYVSLLGKDERFRHKEVPLRPFKNVYNFLMETAFKQEPPTETQSKRFMKRRDGFILMQYVPAYIRQCYEFTRNVLHRNLDNIPEWFEKYRTCQMLYIYGKMFICNTDGNMISSWQQENIPNKERYSVENHRRIIPTLFSDEDLENYVDFVKIKQNEFPDYNPIDVVTSYFRMFQRQFQFPCAMSYKMVKFSPSKWLTFGGSPFQLSVQHLRDYSILIKSPLFDEKFDKLRQKYAVSPKSKTTGKIFLLEQSVYPR
jgi:hypothetical protein